MKKFLGEDFLLENKIAEDLYFTYAAATPIIDYHSHLSPKDIAEDRHFESITDAWLEGDHYKWRAMRTNGIDETFITGNASKEEKFQKWAATVPNTLRNPLYHWTHLELQRYFDIYELLDAQSADTIYQSCNEILNRPDSGCKGLLNKMKVEVVGTTDDPADDLIFHRQLAKSDFEVRILPTFRPDKSLTFEDPGYNTYLDKLAESSGIEIKSLDDLLEALSIRMNFFNENGCKISDHGLNVIPYQKSDLPTLQSNFKKVRIGKMMNGEQIEQLQTYILLELAKGYHSLGWVQQYHLGALRNNNSRAMRELGPDTGYDSIGDFTHGRSLSGFLDTLDNTSQLTKTIIYNLNPGDNALLATMTGNFNDGSVPGKMQFGSGWWYLDQKDGMENQLNSLSNMGLLSQFVGMLTDSRSFLSFPRHEYFRRILCNLIGKDVENGELPNDTALLGEMVENICYHNARRYFNF